MTGSGKITTTDLQVNGSTTTDSIVSKSAAGAVLKLQTSSTDIQGDDLLGKIEFQAPDEGTGDASNGCFRLLNLKVTLVSSVMLPNYLL